MSGEQLKLDRSAVEAREVDDEIVIYDLRGRRYLGGNRTVAALWPLLLEGTDADALAARIESDYGVASEQARADVEAFIDSLRSEGLLLEPED